MAWSVISVRVAQETPERKSGPLRQDIIVETSSLRSGLRMTVFFPNACKCGGEQEADGDPNRWSRFDPATKRCGRRVGSFVLGEANGVVFGAKRSIICSAVRPRAFATRNKGRLVMAEPAPIRGLVRRGLKEFLFWSECQTRQRLEEEKQAQACATVTSPVGMHLVNCVLCFCASRGIREFAWGQPVLY
jgi:hypothetical protein